MPLLDTITAAAYASVDAADICFAMVPEGPLLTLLDAWSKQQHHIHLIPLSSGPHSLLQALKPYQTSSVSVSILIPSHLLLSLAPVLYSVEHVNWVVTVLNGSSGVYPMLMMRDMELPIFTSASPSHTYDVQVWARCMAKQGKPVLHFVQPSLGFEQMELNDAIKQSIINKDAQQWQQEKGLDVFQYHGSPSSNRLVVVLGTASPQWEQLLDTSMTSLVRIVQYRPWVVFNLPDTVHHVMIIEQGQESGGVWLQEMVALLCMNKNVNIKHTSVHGTVDVSVVEQVMRHFDASEVTCTIGDPIACTTVPPPYALMESQVEGPYLQILESLFSTRLELSNIQSSAENSQMKQLGHEESSVEFGLGHQLSRLQQRDRFIEGVFKFIQAEPTSSLTRLLVKWYETRQEITSEKTYQAIVDELESLLNQTQNDPDTLQLLEHMYIHRHSFIKPSSWLIAGDALAYDLNDAGFRQVLACKKNINMLILDTQPYSDKVKMNGLVKSDQRKKDVGLYAMMYGQVYVGSIAVHHSYSQVVKTLQEADAFPGPSIVLAYAPKICSIVSKPNEPTLDHLASLKETKLAIDTGYWPLYRFHPHRDPAFILDSEKLKKELADFLDRENQLALLVEQTAKLDMDIPQDEKLKLSVETKLLNAYKDLMGSLKSRPIWVLYASDGGNAEKLAKKLSQEAKSRGLRPKCMAMDTFGGIQDLSIEPDSSLEEHVVLFLVSTAGQGEFPTNSKEFWKSCQQADQVHLEKVKYAVFGLGDSHYWPLPQDKHYFAKSGKDLHEKLAALKANPLVSFMAGDDQHADGYMTMYHQWTPLVWEALGVDQVKVADSNATAAPTDDSIKQSSNFLRGTILQGLEDTSTGALSELDTKLTKFHGIYQQDDRDIREERLKLGFEPAYSFMIRVRVPGGVSTPQQWLHMDEIADTLANGTLKLTTRQAFQFHGVLKRNLKKSIQEINRALMDTIAACGDVNRNVMCNPNPLQSQLHQEVFEFSKALSDHLTPNTTAYHEIWLDKKVVATTENLDFEPLYGPTYLPRKFKVAIAIPPSNDVDVFAHDLGFIAISEKVNGQEKLIGFNVTVGGGMGMTHGNKKTFPRLADVMCFCTVEQAVVVGEKVMLVQRDFGDRTNRKHARLKYTIEDHGIEWFRQQVEQRCGFPLKPPKPYTFTSNGDRFGWTRGINNTWHFGLFIQNGRVKDTPSFPLKTALKEIALVHKGDFRLTPNQSVIIGNVSEQEKPVISVLLKKYRLDQDSMNQMSGLQLNSMACVALPTCALAMAESERYLPSLVDKITIMLEEEGLRDDAITIRMTGCPNGCARPQIAEIAFIGKAPGAYNMYLGGGFTGERLNKLYKESITEKEILDELKPIIKRYALERHSGEKFGDFCIRAGYVKATTAGRHFHD